MKSTALIFLLLLSIFSFGQSRADLDSLIELSKSMVCVDNEKFDSLHTAIIKSAAAQGYYSQMGSSTINKAYQYRCGGQIKEAISLLDKAISYFNKENDSKGKANAYYQISGCYMSISELDSARYYSNKMYGIAQTLNDSLLLSSYYLVKSSISTMSAQNDSIVFFALKGLDVLGDIENDRIRGSLNYSLGNAFYQNEDFEQAVRYYFDSQKYFPDQSVNLAAIHYNLATAFTQLGSYDTAFTYFDKAISANEKFQRNYYLAFNYQGLAENYNKAGNCQKSIEFNLKSKALSESLGEKRSLAGVYANLVPCYLKLGKVDLAIESAKKAIELTEENGDQDKLADAYFLLHTALLKKGDYKSALEAHHKFYSLDSMLLNRDKQTTIASLETQYDTQKKEAEILTLSQQASIQALEIKQKNQALLIGLVAFLFVLVAIYFLYKQKEAKKQQRQTELEQRFLRSQLNPHFISNALVAVQNFMLKNDSESASLYLTKFSKLMREILENSRREFITVEQEVNMLKNYMDINQQRLGSFEYTIEIDDAIEPEIDTIPPMFVQPFIENAVEHGVGNRTTGGKIELKLLKEGDFIKIEVSDNGQGLTQRVDVSHKSLSTTIIQERMDLFNKTLRKKIELAIGNLQNESGEVRGTKVELKVPFSVA